MFVEHGDCCIVGRRADGGRLRLCEETWMAVMSSNRDDCLRSSGTIRRPFLSM